MTKRSPEPYVPSILVVDDVPAIRTLFRRLLEEAGYFVVESASGREAVRVVQDFFVDVVISDLSLPDMDGFEILRAIRSELPSVKVLMVSGFMSGPLVPIAQKMGANATLDKAAAAPLLLKTVCELLTSP